MSLWRDELKPASGTIACLLGLAVVAVASLSRVIEAPGYLGWAIAALVIGASFALYFGQRSLGLAFVLLVAFGGLTLPALFVGDKTTALLPTPDAFAAVRKLIASGFAAVPKVTPPVAAAPRFTILVWLALLLLGYLGASWVVVRRPVGAVISAIAVVTFAGSVGDGQHRTTYALAAVAVTGAFFLAEGRHRIARWGGGRVSIPAWLGLPTLTIACLLAVGAPKVLGETPIVKLQSAIRPRIIIIKPLSDIRDQLKVDPPREVMRVTSPQATYWRLTGLDAYDGREWVLEARPREVRQGLIPDPEQPPSGEVLEQRYRLTSLLWPWLPAAYAAQTIESEANVQVDPGSQTLLWRDEDSPGLAYVVRSRLPRVTVNSPAEKKEAADERAKIFSALARKIAAGAQTPLDTARRLEAHFRSYKYNEDVKAGHTVERLQRFLNAREGYCEQFAATMTLMLRGLGIEARVGVGFLPGARSGGEFVVTTRDAHAWVEANIPGAGWFAFDPTPGRSDAAGVEQDPQQPEPTALPQPTAVPETTPAPEDLPEEVTTLPVGLRIPGWVPWTLLAAICAAAAPVAKTVRRSRRRRGPPDAVVVGAYTELVDRAEDLGWRPHRSETQREFVTRAMRGDENASSLATLTAGALYGKDPIGSDVARAAWAKERLANLSLRRRSPLWRRASAIWSVRTFLPKREAPSYAAIAGYGADGYGLPYTILGRAGIWRRFVALSIDSFIVGVPTGILLTATFASVDSFVLRQLGQSISWVVLAIYSSVMLSFNSGQTVGKQLMGIAIARPDGRPLDVGTAAVRSAMLVVSAIPLYLGFLWAIWDGRNRAWHDIAADTRAFRVSRSAAIAPRAASAFGPA